MIWNTNSENTTRTLIDMIILDVLSQQRGHPAGNGFTHRQKLNGFQDYFLSYSSNGRRDIQSCIVTIEAKQTSAV
jgi:hypothetical protein